MLSVLLTAIVIVLPFGTRWSFKSYPPNAAAMWDCTLLYVNAYHDAENTYSACSRQAQRTRVINKHIGELRSVTDTRRLVW